jgi:hypothetical protein
LGICGLSSTSIITTSAGLQRSEALLSVHTIQSQGRHRVHKHGVSQFTPLVGPGCAVQAWHCATQEQSPTCSP